LHSLRQERKKAAAEGLRFLRLTGAELEARHWDAFYSFYRNTTDRKWGTPYLTRQFFHQLGERLPDRVLLVLAETADGRPGHGRPVAGALNLIGSHALFGRNWGCAYGDRLPNLHFEVGAAALRGERCWSARHAELRPPLVFLARGADARPPCPPAPPPAPL
jgi:predicted N-acyltransferase